MLALSLIESRAQISAPLAGATLAGVGVVVRDVDKSAKAYADVFGVSVPTWRSWVKSIRWIV